MEKHHRIGGTARVKNVARDGFASPQGFEASPTETAQYLAEMSSELVALARTAGLERLSLLLDYVAREAVAEAARAAA